jgi:hypothetical protein
MYHVVLQHAVEHAARKTVVRHAARHLLATCAVQTAHRA